MDKHLRPPTHPNVVWSNGKLGRARERIQRGEIDPSFLITHRLSLEDAPGAYKTFRDKEEQCIKVVLDPWAERKAA